MNYIINSTAIVFFFDNKPVKVEKTAPEYTRILSAFDLPSGQQEEVINAILNERVGEYEKDGFTISPESVSYDGETLPDILADKVRAIAAEGLPVKLFANFWENLNNNPSASSVRELYDFLAYKELPITEDGFFIAYKGVSSNGLSVCGNTKTKVLQGIVDNNGKIQNNVGDTIEVKRWDVDDNRDNGCSFGLHVGSMDYATTWGEKTLVVKVNPADVVSVPTDCGCQKCRVSKYEVIDSYENEIKSVITDSEGNPMESVEAAEYEDFLRSIDQFCIEQMNEGLRYLRVRAIQEMGDFEERPSRVRVLDGLSDLGYYWDKDSDGEYVVDLND
tara:strand:- start:171 stop:1166 length:996 start_codon:yes stop_codon:yes gene_type:complete